MRQLRQFVANFLSQEDGPTAVEYAVILALIVAACVSSVTALGANASGSFTKVSTKLVVSGS